MDPDYARNYWRSIFVREAQGKFNAADFDKWFPRIGNGEFGDQIQAAFMEMLAACAQGRFGKPAGSE